jgi:hypothetical protein
VRRAARRPGVTPADDGSAVVEFVGLGVLMLVPLIYLVLALGRIQAAAFAADAAARAAARVVVLADSDAAGLARAADAVRLAALDQGFDVDPGQAVAVTCSHRPCLTPGSRVDVVVELEVVLPGVPGAVDRLVPAHVTVRSASSAVVDPFRAAGSPP